MAVQSSLELGFRQSLKICAKSIWPTLIMQPHPVSVTKEVQFPQSFSSQGKPERYVIQMISLKVAASCKLTSSTLEGLQANCLPSREADWQADRAVISGYSSRMATALYLKLYAKFFSFQVKLRGRVEEGSIKYNKYEVLIINNHLNGHNEHMNICMQSPRNFIGKQTDLLYAILLKKWKEIIRQK